jgi:hypothetical protein
MTGISRRNATETSANAKAPGRAGFAESRPTRLPSAVPDSEWRSAIP